MKIDNRQVVEFNLKVLRFIRVYGVEDRKLGWLLAFLALSNNFLQLSDIIHGYKDKTIDGLVIQGFLWVCLFNINSRFIVFLLKNNELDSVMQFIYDIWDETESTKNPIEEEIMSNSLSRGTKIIIFNLGSMIVGITFAASYPLIVGARETPYEWYIPGIDLHKSPFYYLLYGFQAFYLIPGITAISITYANLVVTWLIFGLVAFRLLGEKVRLLSFEANEDDTMKALYECIRLHNRIIQYINVIKGIISPVSFVEIALLSLMLCFLMFYALYINDNIIMLITVIAYVNCIIYMVFMVFLHANDLTYESVTLADIIYDLNWFERSKSFKDCIRLFMIRSQRPVQLRAGIYPLTLPTFMQLIKASYTYLTVLKQIYY